MAKKATTIILVIVVLFLLASTVYVSIILTSETGTTPNPSKASEIEEGTEAVPTDETVVEEPSADPLSVAENQGLSNTEEALNESEATELPVVEPTQELEITPEVTPEEDSELLAYANPSPTGRATGRTSPIPEPTDESVEPTVGIAGNTTEELPGTGQGQPKTTKTPTASPTKAQQQQQQPLPQTMPVAGSIAGPIAAFVVAGATILFAFVL